METVMLQTLVALLPHTRHRRQYLSLEHGKLQTNECTIEHNSIYIVTEYFMLHVSAFYGHHQVYQVKNTLRNE